MIKTSACWEVDAHKPSLHVHNLSHYFDPSLGIHGEPLATQQSSFKSFKQHIFGSDGICLIWRIRKDFWDWDPMSTKQCECCSFTSHCMMFWNSGLVRQPCKDRISIVEGDLQNTVEAPLREFCDRGHAIEVSAYRIAGCTCESIHIEWNTAFGAAELFVESS